MGTRHLISAVVHGETHLAQYGQFDGYLDGHGMDIAAFLRDSDLDKFRDNLARVRLIDGNEAAKMIEAAGFKTGWVTMEEGEKMNAAFPSFSRETSSRILPMILDGEVEYAVDSSDFVEDVLFCEYAYALDLDDQTLTLTAGWPLRYVRTFTFPEFIETMLDDDKRAAVEDAITALNSTPEAVALREEAYK